MKSLSLLAFLWFISLAHLTGTEKLVIRIVTIPAYHLWEDAPVKYIGIPKVGWDLDSAYLIAGFYSESYGKIEGRENDPVAKDINLISAYGFKVEASYDEEKKKNIFIIDKTNAKKPEGYKFSLDDVAQMAIKAIRSDFPDAECSIRNETVKE